jgi:phage portal protein BeeE
VRLIDRMLIRRYGDTFWEGQASGAATVMSTYGSPDRESVLPQLALAASQMYGASGVAFSAILARIMLFSEARFQLQSVSDKKLFGNQSLRILEAPWEDGTTGDLLSRMELDASLAGNAYIWDAQDQLVRWRPDWVTIISRIVDGPRGPYRKKIGFHFEPPKSAQPQYGEPQTVPADEVAHWAPVPDPQAEFRGMSWLTPVLREVQADLAMTGYKAKYLENAATPNLLIKYSQKLQPATIDSLRERITARYGGVDNAFKTLVLDQGADLTVVGNSLSQMDFSNVQSAGTERILAASMVPAVLVGLEPLRGAGRGYEESLVKLANMWARPQWRSACGALQKLVPGMPEQGIRLWYDTSDIAALQDTETNQAQVALIRSQALQVLHQAGYTPDSAVSFVVSGDPGQLVAAPVPPPVPPGGASQHLLPQLPGSGPTPGVDALPAGSVARLPAGTTSLGDGGNQTRPGRRPAATRRP